MHLSIFYVLYFDFAVGHFSLIRLCATNNVYDLINEWIDDKNCWDDIASSLTLVMDFERKLSHDYLIEGIQES